MIRREKRGKLPTSPAGLLCFSARAIRASGMDCGIRFPRDSASLRETFWNHPGSRETPPPRTGIEGAAFDGREVAR